MKTFIYSFKFLRYGLQRKFMVIMGLLFLGMGLLFEFTGATGRPSPISFGGVYIVLAGLYTYQVAFTPCVSKMIAASPRNRMLRTSCPVIATGCSLMAAFTIYFLVRYFYTIRHVVMNDPDLGNPDYYYATFLFVAFLMAMILVYFSFSFRFYIISSILMAIVVIPFLILGTTSNVLTKLSADIIDWFMSFGSMGHALILLCSYIILLIGMLLCYIINVLLYRIEVSELTYRNALRQAASK